MNRLTHGLFDAEAVAQMAALGDPALMSCVQEAADVVWPGRGASVVDMTTAIDVADELCDAIGLTAEARGELDAILGLRGANPQCARYLVAANGDILRARLPGESPACGFGCSGERCIAESGGSPVVAKVLRDWAACGGRDRKCWPRDGGLEDQDAAVVWWFRRIDEALMLRRRPAESAA